MGIERCRRRRLQALAAVLLLAPCAAASDVVAVEKARVVTADGIREGVTLLLIDGRVAALGSELPLPAGCERLDGSGLLLLPGFIDGFAELLPDADAGAPLLPRSEGAAQDYGRTAWAETA